MYLMRARPGRSPSSAALAALPGCEAGGPAWRLPRGARPAQRALRGLAIPRRAWPRVTGIGRMLTFAACAVGWALGGTLAQCLAQCNEWQAIFVLFVMALALPVLSARRPGS
jgi:hypothetical protein